MVAARSSEMPSRACVEQYIDHGSQSHPISLMAKAKFDQAFTLGPIDPETRVATAAANQVQVSVEDAIAVLNASVWELIIAEEVSSNGASRMKGLFPEAYAAFAQPILAAFSQVTTATTESDVAETVYRAANDTSDQLRFPAGPDAVAQPQSAGLAADR